MSFIDTDGRSARFLTRAQKLGHHQRVGTQVIEEVAIDRHLLGVHDVSQHLGEAHLGASRRVTAPILAG